MSLPIKAATAALVVTTLSCLDGHADAAPLSASMALRDAHAPSVQTIWWGGGPYYGYAYGSDWDCPPSYGYSAYYGSGYYGSGYYGDYGYRPYYGYYGYAPRAYGYWGY